MTRILTISLFAFLFVCQADLRAQHSVRFLIVNRSNNEPLPLATVQREGTMIGVSADETGIAEMNDLPSGTHTFVIRFLGFLEKTITLELPYPAEQPIKAALEPEHEELEEVVITTTRGSRTIESIPTRVEYIGAEELEEKITMQPGNIRMVLSESTGIQTQQTSVSSANMTIRIQGLDGRYTQLLRDGFPLYSGFSGGLSIMQIPPLDLKQVDVVKGSASTLYGGGAIAGLVNLVSKLPEEEMELLFFGNGTSAKGLDVSTYYGQKFDKVGFTFFASRNSNEAYDPADIGFSAIPEFTRYTLNPRVFLYPSKTTTIYAGVNTVKEKRIGGDMKYLKGDGDVVHSWFEENDTDRFSTQLGLTKELTSIKINVKNSVGLFDRTIKQRDYLFSGKQLSSFTEATVEGTRNSMDWLVGANLVTDKFDEAAQADRDFRSIVGGLFAQSVFEINEKTILESGVRIDIPLIEDNKSNRLGDWLVLPRVSVLFKWNKAITSRIGGGLGYKVPTIFTEEAEEQVFKNILPIDFSNMKIEKSAGINGDVNYQTLIAGSLGVSLNQMFFYTRLNNALTLTPEQLQPGNYSFSNFQGHTDALGSETNLKLDYEDFKLYVGYTFVDAFNHHEEEKSQLPLTARNRINAVLMYEVEGSLRIGLEAFYFSPQTLTDGTRSTDYWILGFSAQKKWKGFSLFANFENFTDTRQTRFGPLYSGDITNPVFREIYAPLDGFVFNAGFLVSLASKEH